MGRRNRRQEYGTYNLATRYAIRRSSSGRNMDMISKAAVIRLYRPHLL